MKKLTIILASAGLFFALLMGPSLRAQSEASVKKSKTEASAKSSKSEVATAKCAGGETKACCKSAGGNASANKAACCKGQGHADAKSCAGKNEKGCGSKKASAKKPLN